MPRPKIGSKIGSSQNLGARQEGVGGRTPHFWVGGGVVGGPPPPPGAFIWFPENPAKGGDKAPGLFGIYACVPWLGPKGLAREKEGGTEAGAGGGDKKKGEQE